MAHTAPVSLGLGSLGKCRFKNIRPKHRKEVRTPQGGFCKAKVLKKGAEGARFLIMSKKLYIAYGSNMNLRQMADRCPTAKVVDKTALQGYELLFRGGNGGAVATVEKKKGSNVPVLVWELTPADEAALDRYEGYPYFYRKETVKVQLEGEPTKVMVYIMNDGRPLGAPSRYYYEVILEGYTSAGIDTGILIKAIEKCSLGGFRNEG